MQYDLQWISKHATQSYPLSDQAYAQNAAGYNLPMSFILDIQIKVPKSKSALLKDKFYVAGIVDNIDTYTLIIGCQLSTGLQVPCLKAYGIKKSIGISTPLQDRYFVLVADTNAISQQNIKDIVSRFTGTVYIGVTQNTTIPTVQFTAQQTRISPVCVQATQGLDAIVVNNKLIYGVVDLVAGTGIKLSTSSENDKTTIRIAIDPDTVYNGMSSVQQIVNAVKAKLGDPIYNINGVVPDQGGALTIAGLDCIQFSPDDASSHVITVSNPCSKPCCGSVYSDALKAQIQVIRQQQSILRDYFVQQSNNINYIQASLATVIGSK